MKLSSIYINPANPRLIKDDRFKKLCQSIQEFPKMMALRPIIIDNDGMILGGNMRYKALKELGYKEVPDEWVKRDGELTDEEKQRFIIADNVLFGEYDWDMLANEWDKDQLIDWGLEIPDFTFKQEATEDDYEIPDDEIKTGIVLGDLFSVGEHRVMCADSTDSDNVAKLMNGQKADMVFTDPPYGIDLNTDYSKMNSKLEFVKDKHLKSKHGNKYDKVINDDKEYIPDHIFRDFGYCGEIFLWGADYYLKHLPSGGMFVWDKRGNETFDKMWGSCFELCWSRQKHKRDIIRKTWAGVFGTEKEDVRNRIHPTQKPIELCSFFISKFSEENSLIIDLFGGSGSTMVTAHKLNRRCFMQEIDPKYVYVILKRMKKLDNNLQIKCLNRNFNIEKELS